MLECSIEFFLSFVLVKLFRSVPGYWMSPGWRPVCSGSLPGKRAIAPPPPSQRRYPVQEGGARNPVYDVHQTRNYGGAQGRADGEQGNDGSLALSLLEYRMNEALGLFGRRMNEVRVCWRHMYVCTVELRLVYHDPRMVVFIMSCSR